MTMLYQHISTISSIQMVNFLWFSRCFQPMFPQKTNPFERAGSTEPGIQLTEVAAMKVLGETFPMVFQRISLWILIKVQKTYRKIYRESRSHRTKSVQKPILQPIYFNHIPPAENENESKKLGDQLVDS